MATIDPKYLTKEFLAQYAEQQTAKYLSVGPVDEELAEQHIYAAYEVAKLKKPSKVIWYDSPKAIVNSVGASVRDSVRDSVWDSVRASVGASVGASVRDSVRDSVWDSVRASVGASVGDSVGASVWASVRDSVGASVGDSVRSYDSSSYDSWLKFFNDYQEENDFRHVCLFDEMVSGYLLTADVVHIVRKPIFLSRDANGLLDSDARKAFEYADGFGFYYLHGVEFDEKTWSDIVNQRVTLKTLGNIENADQRAVAVQMLKPELLLKQVGAKLIHTGKKGTKLYEVKNFMDTGDTEYCMHMQHPSIEGKSYIEWVEPKIGKQGDADLCQANAFGIPLEDYLLAVEA
jgi:hypothetical protein